MFGSDKDVHSLSLFSRQPGSHAHLQFLAQQAGNLRPHKKLTQIKHSPKTRHFYESGLGGATGINIDYEKT